LEKVGHQVPGVRNEVGGRDQWPGSTPTKVRFKGVTEAGGGVPEGEGDYNYGKDPSCRGRWEVKKFSRDQGRHHCMPPKRGT